MVDRSDVMAAPSASTQRVDLVNQFTAGVFTGREDDRLAERWNAEDDLGLLQRLDVVPRWTSSPAEFRPSNGLSVPFRMAPGPSANTEIVPGRDWFHPRRTDSARGYLTEFSAVRPCLVRLSPRASAR